MIEYLCYSTLTLLLFSLVSSSIKCRSALSQVPGPPFAAWTRLWLVSSLVSGKSGDDFLELHHKYGPVVRTGPNTVLISDPETTRRILAVGSKYKRGPWFDALRLDPLRSNVISERNPKKHQELRYLLSGALSAKGACGLEETVDHQVRKWLNKTDSKHASTPENTIPLDLSESIPWFAVDLISHLCLGKAFGCIDRETDVHGFLSYIRTGMMAQQIMSVFLESKNLLQYLAKSSLVRAWLTLFPHPDQDDGIGRVMREIKHALGKNSETDCSVNKMMDSFFQRGLIEEQSLTEVSAVLASNADNPSSVMQAIIFCIITQPMVYRKLQAEIDQHVSVTKRDTIISDTEARKLPYLQACISEGLRRYPPEMQLRERIVPPEGDTVCGYSLPSGTYVGFNAIATQYHEVYGKDPQVFRPERWLTSDENNLTAMQRTLELLFSHGASKCLGYHMAYMEMNKIVFELFRNFDVSILDPEKPWQRKSRGSFVQKNFYVRLERRSTDSL